MAMERPLLELETERLFLQVPPVGAAARLVDYCVRNRMHLGPWEPTRTAEYYTLPFWRNQILGAREEFLGGLSVRTVLIERDPRARDGGRSSPVVGAINLTQIVRGDSLDQNAQGRGLMTEALAALVTYAFEELDLHRLMANYRPENARSAAVLERLGFAREGFAKGYLYIDGAWRDHVLTALVRPEPSVVPRGDGPARSVAAQQPDLGTRG
jgi:[ribosomal protein S5]-alanine N-acetyltransferase